MYTLRRSLVVLIVAAMPCAAYADDQPILLITTKGAFEAQVVDGIPGAFKPYNKHLIIVQGVGGNNIPPDSPPDTTPDDVPPSTDPIVQQVSAMSKLVLKTKTEGMAAAGVVDTLSKIGLSSANFKEALKIAMGLADDTLSAGGRLKEWANKGVAITADPAKLLAGVRDAWGISAASLNTAYAAGLAASNQVEAPIGTEAALAAEDAALDWSQIIKIIEMIINLLKTLGYIPAGE